MLLKNCSWVITQNPRREILRDVDVLVEGSEIASIGRNLDKSGEVIDCSGKALLPGLVNSHTHLAMTLFRGYADDMLLQEWLSRRIWPLEARLKERHVYAGSLLGALELLKGGVTAFNDMYFFGEGVRRAVEESGIRGVFSQGVLDYPTAEFKNAGEALRLFEALAAKKTGLFTPAVGTHAPYTCSEETLLRAKELAAKHGALIHIHASETRKEVYDSLREKGRRPVEYLSSIGFLGENVLVAHAGWATKGEVAMLAESNAKVAHCPVSNMKLAVGGVAPLPEMFQSNVTVALGSDGAASNNSLDMFQEMKLASLLQKMHRWDATLLPAQKALDMATIDGAAALGMKEKIGSIEPGKKADLILVDLNKPHLAPLHNVVSSVVYSARAGDVDTTIVNGRVLMQGREVLSLDEEEVLERASKAAEELAGEGFNYP
jgi:5-methylthioadenosine/S-adenosylhomocysteine deaminase